MAVPTITALSLTAGSTQGYTYVEITGTNFRAPEYTYPPGAPVPVPEPSISVTFGTVPALETGWISSTLIYAVTPQTAPGVVSVTVKNHDNDGVAIPGETVVKAAAFTFSRPNIREDVSMHHVMVALSTRLQNQVFEKLILKGPHIDYRRNASDSVQLNVPNLTLGGPNFVPNMFYTQQGNEDINTGEDTYKVRKRGMSYDLEFTLDGASDNKRELLGMRNALVTFFRNNTTISLLRDPSDPSKGEAEYELVMGDEGIRDTSILSTSSISTFSCSCMIRAFEVESAGTFTDDSIVFRGETADTLEFGGPSLFVVP